MATRRMEIGINQARPEIMHIDLNSCFATVEQQAQVSLRGRPVAIVNRPTMHTAIITASYEAKKLGIGVGMRIKDALKICPNLIMLEVDPPKYRFVYHRLMQIMRDYSSHVRMKSIDEGVIDFSEAPPATRRRDMVELGLEIKQRLKDEIGSAMRCNIGIGPNRFLAKTAAGMNKPNGLTVIDHTNIHHQFSKLKLTDLTGIAKQMQKRLNAVGIFTAEDFLGADEVTLREIVFKSVYGNQWYRRLRGYEVDKFDSPLKSAGRQYVLEDRNLTKPQIIRHLHKLCEEVGAKIRRAGVNARGVMVYAKSSRGEYWRARHVAILPFYSDSALFVIAKQLFGSSPSDIIEIGVTCYALTVEEDRQLSIFGDEMARQARLVAGIDDINRRYGARGCLHRARH